MIVLVHSIKYFPLYTSHVYTPAEEGRDGEGERKGEGREEKARVGRGGEEWVGRGGDNTYIISITNKASPSRLGTWWHQTRGCSTVDYKPQEICGAGIVSETDTSSQCHC